MNNRDKWRTALDKASALEAQKAIVDETYPRHISGVARQAFRAGAIWAQRYLRRRAQ